MQRRFSTFIGFIKAFWYNWTFKNICDLNVAQNEGKFDASVLEGKEIAFPYKSHLCVEKCSPMPEGTDLISLAAELFVT